MGHYSLPRPAFVDAFSVDVSVLSNANQQSFNGNGGVYYQLDSGFDYLFAMPENHFAWHHFAVAKITMTMKMMLRKLGFFRLSLMIPLLLVGAVFLIYAQVVKFEFLIWDDAGLIYDNPLYNPPNMANFSSIWRTQHLDLYIPFTYSAWHIITGLWWSDTTYLSPTGTNIHFPAYPFHAANFLLHIGCVLLVYSMLRLILSYDTKQQAANDELQASRLQNWHVIASGCGALFFALHPLQVESVAWASELKGVLCSFFTLLSWWQFMKSLQIGSKFHAQGLEFGSLVCYILAVLAKPTAIPAPLIALLLGKIVSDLSWRDLFIKLRFWWLICLAAIIIAHKAQPAETIVSLWWWRPFVAGDALAFYLGKLFWPFNLSPHYPRTPSILMEHWWAYAMWLVPALLVIAAWSSRHKQLKIAIALWFVPLIPVLGLITFLYQRLSTVADRYNYLALLGPAFLLAWAINKRKSPILVGLAFFYVSTLGFLSYRQSMVWSDSVTLFNHSLAMSSRSWVSKVNLGALARQRGQTDLAINLYRQGCAEPTLDPVMLNDYGTTLGKWNALSDAESCFRRAISIAPNYAEAWSNLGTLYIISNHWAQAIEVYQRAIKIDSHSAELYMNLGLAFGPRTPI